jgi:hypothetical protein
MKIMLTVFFFFYIEGNSESTVLSQSAEMSKMSGEKDLSFGETTPGFSVMTRRQLLHCY